MNRSLRRMPGTSVMRVANVALAGALIGGAAVGFAAGAHASPCNSDTIAMTPQPVLSCPGSPGQAAAPPSDATAVIDPAANALPAPGQAPHVPPVFNEDGTQSFDGGDYLGDIWNEFNNGVPSDLIYGTPPGNPAPLPPVGEPLPPAVP